MTYRASQAAQAHRKKETEVTLMDTIKTFLTTKSIYRVPVLITVTGLTLVFGSLLIAVPSMVIASVTGIQFFATVSGLCAYLPVAGFPLFIIGFFASLTATLVDAHRIDRAFWARYPKP